jgi:hypothetical protein
MAKNKKPTMMQVKDVVNKVIGQIEFLRQGITQLDFLFHKYLEFTKDKEMFKAYLEAEKQKAMDKKEKQKKEEGE